MSACPLSRISFGPHLLGQGCPLLVIAGPCVIESEEHARMMAQRLRDVCGTLDIPFVFKASFDKANRSSVTAYRGPGLEKGLAILARIREDFGIPVLTDLHETAQAAPVADAVDVLQIPAFLCRQTELLLAVGQTGRTVNIKKGQFMAPWDMPHVVGKVLDTGNPNVCITERGASFGYNNLVSDMRGLAIMRETAAPVIFDATHSAQLPGGQGSCSGGDRKMAVLLARAAVAAGVDGVFMEVHDNPDAALCDGPNMIALDTLPALLEQLKSIHTIVSDHHTRC